ncbi:uncharacterized protein BO96DRAFT_500262 [Aspergillus niger CBS 101883]|uniref:Zn(2)-C6 fungal-type domain-containing protein n=1 Tax=Aspergillus niger ATCC 13496 TaxID=1353008 RepID=A0A370BL13_ASPNG|nr:hypothetical protein ANI_1_2502074 [Aspergillus niger CBS 513.88]XP_025454609.1 uncharacterized protein BO96DRAFT_500262 [Aspergillus niger CBS 101883]PYH56554.1 hypothetical protein BO96DRAFT_500262 [Aspergillus niger CBS 101883]RDH16236.1 hypothetical protein M747DRAFT_287282 [Aspergillus niger ATCC 13496]|eukprot:XP_001393201.2 hypothetical protein ANI_1_2502074 [Aspergillus niger CBS 513.88]
MFRHFQMPPPPNGNASQSDAAGRPKDRTRRACERCRQMKIKCDGATTCNHCRTSFNECVYPEPRRKRKASPHFDRLQELEKRVKAMEESYQTISATKDSSQSPNSATQHPPPSTAGANDVGSDPTDPRPQLRSSQGEARFGFSSADRAFIERLKAELGDWPGADFDSRLRIREKPGVKLFQSATPAPRVVCLPPRERAEHLINIALDASVLYHVVHRPTFDSAFELLYSLDRSDYGEGEMRHIPLVYALMALGCLFEKIGEGPSESGDDMTAERTKYFATCRDLVDLHDCNDIVTLQAIFYMNLFILSTERLSPCYTCLSHAFSLAVRMNLQLPNSRDNLIVAEIKRRLFWSLRQLLMVVASMCGYPRPINSNEVDIEQPLDLDDNDLKSTRISQSLQDPALIRSMSGSVALLKLHNILDRIVRELYPSGGVRRKTNSGSMSHLVSNEIVTQLEEELQKWSTSLPLGYKRGTSRYAPHLEKAKYELWMTYAHVQILLYRPFLHYFVDSTEGNGHAEHGFHKYASACVDASRNLIHLTEDMHRDGLLYGAHWRIAYMVCTAGLSLIYVVVGSKNPDTARNLKMDLNTAKRMLMCLTPYSSHSRRLHVALTVLTATFTKSDHGSQSQSPNDTAEAAPDKPHEPYTGPTTRQAYGASPQGNQKYNGPGAGEVVAPSPELFTRGVETHPSQPNRVEAYGMIPASQPPLSHLDSTPVPSGYVVPPLQPGAPGTTMPTPAPENTTPQSAERVMEALAGAAATYGPEPGLGDQTYYLEARPFNLQRPTEGEEYLFGREFGEFDGMTGDLLSFDYLF